MARQGCAGWPAPVDRPARVGSLFSGYGGLDLAVASVIDAEVLWHCEIDPAAVAVLEHRRPGVPNLGDVAALDWASAPGVDVLTGGFPCQDVSEMGLSAGLGDGTRSGLWLHMARAVAALRPSAVVIENVRGLTSAWSDSDVEPCPSCLGGDGLAPEARLRALGRVLGDLADLGYDARWCLVRASDVGAPHERRRVFILAFARDSTRGTRSAQPAADLVHGRSERTTGGPVGRAAGGVGRFDFGEYAESIRRWESVLGRPAPCPVIEEREGVWYANPEFVEWMQGLDQGWVTEVPGLDRGEMMRLLGNGVVPRQGAFALRTLGLASRGVSRYWGVEQFPPPSRSYAGASAGVGR